MGSCCSSPDNGRPPAVNDRDDGGRRQSQLSTATQPVRGSGDTNNNNESTPPPRVGDGGAPTSMSGSINRMMLAGVNSASDGSDAGPSKHDAFGGSPNSRIGALFGSTTGMSNNPSNSNRNLNLNSPQQHLSTLLPQNGQSTDDIVDCARQLKECVESITLQHKLQREREAQELQQQQADDAAAAAAVAVARSGSRSHEEEDQHTYNRSRSSHSHSHSHKKRPRSHFSSSDINELSELKAALTPFCPPRTETNPRRWEHSRMLCRLVRVTWQDIAHTSRFQTALVNEWIAAQSELGDMFFPAEDSKSQIKRMVNIVSVLVKHLEDPPHELRDFCFQIGFKHFAFGIQRRHLERMSEIYLNAVTASLGLLMTDQIQEAFEHVFKIFIPANMEGSAVLRRATETAALFTRRSNRVRLTHFLELMDEVVEQHMEKHAKLQEQQQQLLLIPPPQPQSLTIGDGKSDPISSSAPYTTTQLLLPGAVPTTSPSPHSSQLSESSGGGGSELAIPGSTTLFAENSLNSSLTTTAATRKSYLLLPHQRSAALGLKCKHTSSGGSSNGGIGGAIGAAGEIGGGGGGGGSNPYSEPRIRYAYDIAYHALIEAIPELYRVHSSTGSQGPGHMTSSSSAFSCGASREPSNIPAAMVAGSPHGGGGGSGGILAVSPSKPPSAVGRSSFHGDGSSSSAAAVAAAAVAAAIDPYYSLFSQEVRVLHDAASLALAELLTTCPENIIESQDSSESLSASMTERAPGILLFLRKAADASLTDEEYVNSLIMTLHERLSTPTQLYKTVRSWYLNAVQRDLNEALRHLCSLHKFAPISGPLAVLSLRIEMFDRLARDAPAVASRSLEKLSQAVTKLAQKYDCATIQSSPDTLRVISVHVNNIVILAVHVVVMLSEEVPPPSLQLLMKAFANRLRGSGGSFSLHNLRPAIGIHFAQTSDEVNLESFMPGSMQLVYSGDALGVAQDISVQAAGGQILISPAANQRLGAEIRNKSELPTATTVSKAQTQARIRQDSRYAFSVKSFLLSKINTSYQQQQQQQHNKQGGASNNTSSPSPTASSSLAANNSPQPKSPSVNERVLEIVPEQLKDRVFKPPDHQHSSHGESSFNNRNPKEA